MYIVGNIRYFVCLLVYLVATLWTWLYSSNFQKKFLDRYSNLYFGMWKWNFSGNLILSVLIQFHLQRCAVLNYLGSGDNSPFFSCCLARLSYPLVTSWLFSVDLLTSRCQCMLRHVDHDISEIPTLSSLESWLKVSTYEFAFRNTMFGS